MEENVQEGAQEVYQGTIKSPVEPVSYGKCFTHEQLYNLARGCMLSARQMGFQRSGEIGTYSQRTS